MRPRSTPPRLLPLLLAGLLTVLLGVVMLGPGGTAHANQELPAAPEGETPGRLVLVLDSSGSMAEPAGGGTTKIQAAKDALGRVVEQLPDNAEVGIRVFGAKVFDRSKPGACTDSQSVVPVGPLDRAALTAAVEDYEPYGETPIGHALQEAGKDLAAGTSDGSQEGARTIVLLSDGEPTCEPDPCKVASKLSSQGIDLTINVVGLDVSGKAREALRCIAREGKGDYYDARSADDLATSLVKVSVRPMRTFAITGEPVTGGLSIEEALPLEPGTYQDISVPEDGSRYYLLSRPTGGGISASILTRPAKGEKNWASTVALELMTPDGDACEMAFTQELQILGLTPISAAGVEQHALSGSSGRVEECLSSDTLVLGVSLSAEPTDFLLRVENSPAFENAEEFPEALDSDAGGWAQPVKIPAGERTPVAGGVSFGDAPALEPGVTYTDTLRPTEQLVYRVSAEYGQAVRVSARLAPEPAAADKLGALGNHVQLIAHSALWHPLPAAGSDAPRDRGFYNGAEASLLTAVVPPIRVANTNGPWRVEQATRGGDQFFVLGMGGSGGTDPQDEFAAPVTLRAEVVGDPEGVPHYAEDASAPGASQSPATDPTAASTPEAEESDTTTTAAEEAGGSGVMVWLALGAVLALALVGGGFAFARRSRGAADGQPGA